MNSRVTERFDLLQAAIGLFVVLGVVLTALAGYALLVSFDVTVSVGAAVSLLSGASLIVFAVILTLWLNRGAKPRTPRKSA